MISADESSCYPEIPLRSLKIVHLIKVTVFILYSLFDQDSGKLNLFDEFFHRLLELFELINIEDRKKEKKMLAYFRCSYH